MTTARAERLVVPTSEVRKEAKAALAGLTPILESEVAAARVVLQAEGLPRSRRVVLPRVAFDLLHQVLEQVAAGNAMTLVPVHAELTTQEAAELLNVSRPFLIRLLEEKKLPYRRVGSHRRLRAEDVFAFRTKDDAERQKAAGELSAESQKLGLGY